MSTESLQRKTYMGLGLLDFLAYYVPGVLTIISIYFIASSLNILHVGEVTEFVKNLNIDPYIQSITWTLFLLVIPYVLGHLIFPVGYIFSKFMFKAKPDKYDESDTNASKYDCIEIGDYCKQESMEYTKCVFHCFSKDNFAFSELMITRFRTLSRFCRSMLLPIILLSISIFVLAFRYLNSEFRGFIFMIVCSILLLGSIYPLGLRHRKYEKRWRNAVCVGKAL